MELKQEYTMFVLSIDYKNIKQCKILFPKMNNGKTVLRTQKIA